MPEEVNSIDLTPITIPIVTKLERELLNMAKKKNKNT